MFNTRDKQKEHREEHRTLPPCLGEYIPNGVTCKVSLEGVQEDKRTFRLKQMHKGVKEFDPSEDLQMVLCHLEN